MRLRLPELLDESGKNAYQLARESNGRISLSTAYRLKGKRGQVALFDRDVLAAICDVCGVGPDRLFSRDDEEPPPPKAKATKPPARAKRARAT